MKLEMQGLTLSYGGDPVVSDVSFSIDESEILTVIGANGSGKSTLVKAIARSLKPRAGIVLLDGKSIAKEDTRALARKMAILPQVHSAPPDFTVRDLAGYGRFPHLGITSRLGPDDFAAVERALDLTKMGELAHRNVNTLSGGERQRAWIAMALAQEPQVLLLDEPTTFLDISHQFDLLELISRLNTDSGLTILMVLHDLNQAARYSHRLVVLKEGRVYRIGSPAEIIREDVLSQVFNISVRILTDPEYGCPYFIPIKSENGRVDLEGAVG